MFTTVTRFCCSYAPLSQGELDAIKYEHLTRQGYFRWILS